MSKQWQGKTPQEDMRKKPDTKGNPMVIWVTPNSARTNLFSAVTVYFKDKRCCVIKGTSIRELFHYSYSFCSIVSK